MHIYFISGLGVDYRAFKPLEKIILQHQPEVNFHSVDWIIPEKDDTIFSYCEKLSSQIKHDDYVLIGLSFGGLCSQVISKIKKPSKLILISSFLDHSDLPRSFQALKIVSPKIMSLRVAKRNSFLNNYVFGVKTPQGKELLKNIVRDTDKRVFHWSIKQIIQWNPQDNYDIDLHLIGDKDKIVPRNHGKNVISIPGGGHFMIFERAEEMYQKIKGIIIE